MGVSPVHMTPREVAMCVAYHHAQGARVQFTCDLDRTILAPGATQLQSAKAILALYGSYRNWRRVIVTGRSPDETYQMIGDAQIAYFGDMGVAWIGFPDPVREGDRVRIHRRAVPFVARIEQLIEVLVPYTRLPNVQLLRKTTGVALVCGTPENRQLVERRLEEDGCPGDSWRIEPSQRTLAFVPQCGVDKGTALMEAYRTYRPALLLVAGDSAPDEPLFAAARELEAQGQVTAVTIAVCSEGTTDALLRQANCIVQGVSAMHDLLTQVQALLDP